MSALQKRFGATTPRRIRRPWRRRGGEAGKRRCGVYTGVYATMRGASAKGSVETALRRLPTYQKQHTVPRTHALRRGGVGPPVVYSAERPPTPPLSGRYPPYV